MLDVQIMQSKVRKLARKYQLSLVVLFGSQVTGNTHRQSDVDFGFLSETTRGFVETAAIELDFMRTLGVPRLELVDLAALPPLLLRNVARSSILLYEGEPSLFANFKIYALRRYRETKPLIALREKQLAEFVQTL